jgi:hypothetical protein
MAREQLTRDHGFWISLVPSPMIMSGASRK